MVFKTYYNIENGKNYTLQGAMKYLLKQNISFEDFYSIFITKIYTLKK